MNKEKKKFSTENVVGLTVSLILHYLKIAFRNLWKYKTQSLTGIFGLAFGLACFVPALYWLRYETSYDSSYPDAKHIYRVYSVDKQTGKTNELVSGMLERKMHEQFAATENSTVFFVFQDNCSTEGMPHIQLRTVFTDNSFLNVFPQAVISGDAQRPLEVLNSMVITESLAVRMFGDVEKAIGQQIKSTLLSRFPPYRVTAVVKDPPPNTNVSFDAILYHEQLTQQKTYIERSVEQIWTFATLQMYMKLPPQADVAGLAEQMRDFPSRLDANANLELQILPVSDVRYRLNTDTPFTLNFIRLFAAAGILLMCCALFNFLSLHLNLYRQRINELRRRAVHGANGRQLTVQMLCELTCSTLLSLLLSLFFILIFRTAFSGLLNITMDMTQLIRLFVICGTSVTVLIWGVGLIPFWRLSYTAQRPMSNMKITGQPASQRIAVTFQLAVSVVFMVASLVVMMQMRFVDRKDLGFDCNRIIQISGLSFFVDDDIRSRIINEFASIPQIENFTTTYFKPQHLPNAFNSEIHTMTDEVEWSGKQLSENPVFQTIIADSHFAEVFGLNMRQGEWYDETSEHKIVLNEEAVRVMGLSDPVGAVIHFYGNKTEDYTVVGVVKDFHTLSLRTHIYPTIFFNYKYTLPDLYVRFVSGQEQSAIQRINAVLPRIMDASYIDIHPTPLKEMYDRLNQSEQAGLKLFSVLATVCLLISLFGIYAVATASTQRRRKEIAIRKVFGAEVSGVVRKFFREHALQALIAGAVALPLAYYAMYQWLQGYAYRTNIPWWLLTGVIIVTIALVLITVIGQVWKAANTNPTEGINT